MAKLTPAEIQARVDEFRSTPAARHRRRLRLGADLAGLRDDTLHRLVEGRRMMDLYPDMDPATLADHFFDLFDAYTAIVDALADWKPDNLAAAAAIFGAEVDTSPPTRTLIDPIDVVWREV